MFHLCAICRTHDTYATHVPWHFTRTRMIPCSSRVKCHTRDVPCVFHGILHVKVCVHTLREMWSTQTRDVNLEYLCRVSLRVHACKSEVTNEWYCRSSDSFSVDFITGCLGFAHVCKIC